MKYIQWTEVDDGVFLPAGQVVKQLPPGYYDVERNMQGTYFVDKKIKTEALYRFPDTASDKVLNEIKSFWALEDRFKRAEVPYRRGIMMMGPPGSGKSCCIRLAVEDLIKNRSGVVLDWPGVHLVKESYTLIRKIHPNMPLIYLMEDVDSILARSCESEILNMLDGMFDLNKVVFLATTNYPEKIRSNIMSRPSRFDRVIEIGMPCAESRRIYIRSKLPEADGTMIERWVKDTNGLSIAHIKELYIATQILENSYEATLQALKGMNRRKHSSSFDPYMKESVGNAVKSHKRFLEEKEAFYEMFGTGKAYRNFVPSSRQVMPDEDEISRLISESL